MFDDSEVSSWLLLDSRSHIILLRLVVDCRIVFIKRVRHPRTLGLVNIGLPIRDSLPAVLAKALKQGLS